MTPHLSHNIYFSFLFQQNDCTPPKYGDSVHTEVDDSSSRCMNVSGDDCQSP